MSKPFVDRLIRVVEQIDLAPCNGCDRCGLRCTAGVQITYAEYLAIRQFIKTLPYPQEIARVVQQDKTLRLDGTVSVSMCRFRDMERGRCAIYPARPLVCRLLGHVEWLPCPIGKIDRIARTEDALALMREYAKQARKTFEEWDEKEKKE